MKSKQLFFFPAVFLFLFPVSSFSQNEYHIRYESVSDPNTTPPTYSTPEEFQTDQMQIKLLQKIEELTLYVIDLKKENDEMRNDNAEMKAEIEKLKRR